MTENSNYLQDINSPTDISGMQSSLLFLEAIKQATLQVASSLKREDILYNTLRICFELIPGMQHAEIFLLESGEMRSRAAMSADGVARFALPDPDRYRWIHDFIQLKEMTVLQNLKGTSAAENFPQDWQGAMIAQPFEIHEAAVGLLVLVLENSRDLSRNEKFLLSLLKDQAAISLHNALLHKTIEEQAMTDSLTGLPNRRSMDDCLQEELERAKHRRCPLSLLLLDFDHFKQVNDRFGHPAGDLLLIQAAQHLRQVIRRTDFIARYGGDEFAVILPETSLVEAKRIAFRIQKDLEGKSFGITGEVSLHLSASIGISAYPDHGSALKDLLDSADRDLYSKKSAPS